MTSVASRDLRNHTADVLRRVADGDVITITVNGTPVADLTPHRSARRTSLRRNELVAILSSQSADAALRGDLERLAGDTTDDLDPMR